MLDRLTSSRLSFYRHLYSKGTATTITNCLGIPLMSRDIVIIPSHRSFQLLGLQTRVAPRWIPMKMHPLRHLQAVSLQEERKKRRHLPVLKSLKLCKACSAAFRPCTVCQRIKQAASQPRPLPRELRKMMEILRSKRHRS